MMKNNDPRADDLYEKLKVKCIEGLALEEIEFDVWPIPGTGDIKNLTNNEYEQAVSKITYGFRVDSRYVCPASQE